MWIFYKLYSNFRMCGFAINWMVTSVCVGFLKIHKSTPLVFLWMEKSRKFMVLFSSSDIITNACLCYSWGSELSFHLFCFGKKIKFSSTRTYRFSILFLALHPLFYAYFFPKLKVNLWHVVGNMWSHEDVFFQLKYVLLYWKILA